MNGGMDLEALRELFSRNKSSVVVGKVNQVEMATDRSVLMATCEVLTQGREVVAKVTWDSIGPGSGFIQIPQKDDLVLLVFADEDPDQCFLIQRLSSSVDKIPKQAESGDTVLRSLEDKNLHLYGKQVYVGLGASDDVPDEPLVLGNVLINCLVEIMDAILEAPQIAHTAVGPAVLDPAIRLRWTLAKLKYFTVPTTNIVSQVGFTERGD